MSDIDQQIQVTISKIFNWPTSYLNSELSIQFRTLLNQTAIFSKKITPLRRSNILRLNCSLKITFNPAQNHLIASLLSASRQQLMTFLIDLQGVKERKVMFIKEQNGQCMLQVDCRSLQKQENGQKIEKPIETKSTLDNFISQKQKLITVMSEKSFKSSNPKDTFAQGLYSLLLQTRQVRNNGVVKQQQINGISTKKAEQFRYQSLKDYMIGEHKLSVKDLKMLPTPRNSLRINRSLDSKFSPYKQL